MLHGDFDFTLVMIMPWGGCPRMFDVTPPTADMIGGCCPGMRSFQAPLYTLGLSLQAATLAANV